MIYTRFPSLPCGQAELGVSSIRPQPLTGESLRRRRKDSGSFGEGGVGG